MFSFKGENARPGVGSVRALPPCNEGSITDRAKIIGDALHEHRDRAVAKGYEAPLVGTSFFGTKCADVLSQCTVRLPRFIGIVDLGIITVLFVLAVLPPREQIVSTVEKKPDETKRFQLALAEARAMARPNDGVAIAAAEQKMSEAGFKDWAVEVTVASMNKMAPDEPSRWRALQAASTAYVDRLDVKPALEQANLALNACRTNPASCPNWEEVRLGLYQQHLDAGVKSGIDPHKDPHGFAKAAQNGLIQVHVKDTQKP